MPLEFWIPLVILAAATTGCVVYVVARARHGLALSREREALAVVRGQLEGQRIALEQSLKATEETAKRKALEDFLADMRVEERHYIRRHKLLFLNRKSLVVQERIYFRNIPLSSWVEQERVIEEGVDIEEMARSLSIFDPGTLLSGAGSAAVRRVLH